MLSEDSIVLKSSCLPWGIFIEVCQSGRTREVCASKKGLGKSVPVRKDWGRVCQSGGTGEVCASQEDWGSKQPGGLVSSAAVELGSRSTGRLKERCCLLHIVLLYSQRDRIFPACNGPILN